ncbi:hypothetical protein AC739_11840 [Planococcus glaciei]|nr:hypothetical protein AC739_11840 [Planococcus glaciei]
MCFCFLLFSLIFIFSSFSGENPFYILMQEAIEDVSIRRIEHAGHMLQWDERDETAAAISTWLNKRSHSASTS